MDEQNAVTIIMGDSHYAAIAVAAQQTLPHLQEVGSSDLYFFDAWKYNLNYEFVVQQDGRWVLNPNLICEIDNIRKNYSKCVIVSIFGGGHHHALTMLQSPAPFDVVLPEEPDLPIQPDHTILTVRAVESVFLEPMTNSFLQMSAVREAFPDVDYYQLEAPPSVGSDDYIAQNLGNWFESRLPKDHALTLTSKSVRYKMWRVQSGMCRKFCDEKGIFYQEVPASSLTADGFLKSEYYGVDSTHTSAGYGRLVLDGFEPSVGKFVAWASFG